MTEAGAERGTSPVRWWVLALVVVATLVNYVDRQIIAILKPELERTFGWTDSDYGHVVSAFQLSVAIAYAFAGWAIDRLGVRRSYAIAVAVWSAAAMAHAAARTVAQFMVARIVLGAAESANTPAAVKTLSEWFGERERALAIGCMNAGANFGAIASPLVIPLLAAAFGWQAAFVITGAIGFVWLAGWLAVRQPAGLAAVPAGTPAAATASARQPGRAGEAASPVAAPPRPPRWRDLLAQRRTWAFVVAKTLTDAVWWLMLFWLPDLLHKVFALDMRTAGAPLALVYALAAAGALSGGWLPGALMRRGWDLQRARMTTLLVASLCVLPVPLALGVHSYWTAALLVGVGLAAHQAFSTNVFALAGDLFPRTLTASVVGLGALFGNVGGFLMLEATGRVLEATGSYLPMFLYCAAAYLVGWAVVRRLVRRFPERVNGEVVA